MFENDLIVQISDVFVFSQQKGCFFTDKRGFCGVSLRKNTDVKFKSKKQTLRFSGDAVLVVPPNTEYTRYSYTDKDLIVIHFYLLNSEINEISFTPITAGDGFEEEFNSILSIWQKKEVGYRFFATSILYSILGRLEQRCRNEDFYSKNYATAAAEIIERSFPNSDFTIQKLSEALNVCPSQLRKKFKEKYGVSPVTYLQTYRINYAKALIRTEYFTQSEIAEKCGFCDVKYFRSAFKRIVGKSVSDYKKSLIYQKKS